MIIIVDKPCGITSHKVAASIKRACGGGIRVGHTGTLDPMCTGVLPILTGHDTKLSDLFESDKEYIASVLLGVRTDTQDITGSVLQKCDVHVSESEFKAALKEFEGVIEQVPPMYSAVKIGGRKLYELARAGKEIDRPSRTVRIYETEYMGMAGRDEYKIRIKCSKGTYIRTICDELGVRLGCGGTMTSLCRTVSNGFSLRQAYSLSEVIEYSESGKLGQLSLDAESAFGSRRRCIVPHEGEKYFLNGGIIAFSRVGGVLPENGELLRAYSLESAFLGLARGADDGIKCIWKNNSDPEK